MTAQQIVLRLKPEAKEFADGMRLRNLVKKYSDHISFPVVMASESEEEEEPTTSNKAPKSAHANTNKITQLAYAVNSKVPKGKKKEIARLRRWLTFAKRKVLLTLDDLGEVSPSILQMPT